MHGVSWFLLLIMLFQPLGYLAIFKVQQYQVRREIKQRIKAGVPEHELVLLKIPRALEEQPNSSFQRIHSREFRYHGMMYDIVRQESHGDATWYYCILDAKESGLFANLDELVKRETAKNSRHKQQTERFYQLLNVLFIVQRVPPQPPGSERERELANYRFRLQTWTSTPPTPPPKVQVSAILP